MTTARKYQQLSDDELVMEGEMQTLLQVALDPSLYQELALRGLLTRLQICLVAESTSQTERA